LSKGGRKAARNVAFRKGTDELCNALVEFKTIIAYGEGPRTPEVAVD
jgi:hypothetical protein